MRCLMCYAEMTLVMATPDDTMPVAGFEHHTFMCSRCGDVESRLTFVKRRGDAASPTLVPEIVAPEELPATGHASRPADRSLLRDVVTRVLARPRLVAQKDRKR
jgi:hypothetical protein